MGKKQNDALPVDDLHRIPRIVIAGKKGDKKRQFAVNRKFESPEALYASCFEYFEWARANPVEQIKPITVALGANMGSDIQDHAIQVDRPFTIGSLCLFIGCSGNTWYGWKDKFHDLYWEEALPVIEWAELVIYEQKFAGAMTNVYNASLVSKDLGLVQRQDVTSGGAALPGPDQAKKYDLSQLNPEEILEFRALMLKMKREEE